MPRPEPERIIKRRNGARVVVLADAEVLLQGDTDPGLPGSRFWQVPGGGIDVDEDPRQAVVREVYEETGLRVAPADLQGPIASRIVSHGYSDRILIQAETFFLLRTDRFEPVDAQLTAAERTRRVETAWFRLDALPGDLWPAQLATLAAWDGGDPIDLGRMEESTVPLTSADRDR